MQMLLDLDQFAALPKSKFISSLYNYEFKWKWDNII